MAGMSEVRSTGCAHEPAAKSRRRSVAAVLACVASLLLFASGLGAVARAETQTAPKVTKQPQALTVEEGQSASFEATASGNPAPTVQWEVSTNGSTYTPIEGATSDQLVIAQAKVSESGEKVRAVFTNVVGKATTAAAILTVHKIPVVTRQPQNATVEEGQSAKFEAAAEGSPAPTVAWEDSTDGGTTWAAVAGGTSDTLTVTGTKTTDSGRLYRATFKNLAGKTSSEAALLTVQKLPAVTKQPASLTVDEGHTATFEATASGFPAPAVQWQLSTDGGAVWTPIEGASSDVLTISIAVLAESGDEFRAVFSNGAGQATSSPATLTVYEPPTVTAEPASATVEEGQSATFEAAATGVPSPTVQWEISTNGGSSWTAVAGATTDELTVGSAKTSESGHEYRADFQSAAGSTLSSVATLTVQLEPAITKQPADALVDEGQSATFEASASGFPAPGAQWEVSADEGATWTPIAGATSSRLTLTDVSATQSGDEYRVLFSNGAGTATSEAATLTVQAPPSVTQQPQSTTVEAGQPASFEAAASGSPPPSVQWELSTNGGSSWSDVAGATSDELAISATQLSENGHDYRAVFTNVAGTATTAVATLTVASTHYSAVAWGENLERQLGNGSLEAYEDLPVGVSGLKFVTAVSAGGEHSLALLANGTVDAWGGNEFGQLGDGGTATSGVPVPVTGLSGVTAIAAGGEHSLALLANGTVMAWGDNEDGQLGTGNAASSDVPVQVKGLTGVKAIAAGGEHSLALLSNGTVMAWGENEDGQLGTGSLKSSTVPVAVKGLTGVTAVSAGGEFSLALLAKGAVDAWGSDESGQLGNTGVEEGFSDVAVPVGTLTGVSAISAGTNHGLALMSGGTVMAWGDDSYGELGNGAIKASQATPVAVSGLSGASAISAGGHDSAALMTSGSVMTWGINRWGTLGDGTTGSPSDVPVTVQGIANVASVSAGGAHMLAFGEPMPAVTGLSPEKGPAAGGNTVTITGANLEEASAVKFGSVLASEVRVLSPTSVTAVAPAGTGTVYVTVTTPNGVSSPSMSDRYSYVKAPTVTKLTPKTGPTAGETTVTITGTELSTATGVSFGGIGARFKVDSNTSITATAPAAAAAGIVDVTVTAAGGTSATSTRDHYSYAPTVESLSPAIGSTSGGEVVTVTGTGFALGSTATVFKFGTHKSTSVSCASSTTCTVTTPKVTTAGTVELIATVAKVNSAKNPPGDSFTYE